MRNLAGRISDAERLEKYLDIAGDELDRYKDRGVVGRFLSRMIGVRGWLGFVYPEQDRRDLVAEAQMTPFKKLANERAFLFRNTSPHIIRKPGSDELQFERRSGKFQSDQLQLDLRNFLTGRLDADSVEWQRTNSSARLRFELSVGGPVLVEGKPLMFDDDIGSAEFSEESLRVEVFSDGDAHIWAQSFTELEFNNLPDVDLALFLSYAHEMQDAHLGN